MFAVIKTGGKQYIVEPGQKLKVEKLPKEEGSISFDSVLLMEDGKKIEIGAPFIKGAKVSATILQQGKGKKVIVFKHKAKKRMKTKNGHRQPFTEVEITKIEATKVAA